VNYLDVRAKAAAALAPMDVDDPPVHLDYPDALDPPCLVVGWVDPMLEPAGFCKRTARLAIWAVGSRLEPGAGVAACEQLAQYADVRLAADVEQWPLIRWGAPVRISWGGTPWIVVVGQFAVNVSMT
jgi:hypothetical protein